MNTPWAQSQAGLAAAEAGWAVTAGENYQQYVAALDLAEDTYSTNNTQQFVNEIKAIDLADRVAADDNADAGLGLTLAVGSKN